VYRDEARILLRRLKALGEPDDGTDYAAGD
jgi:hypothetical protein